MVNSGNFEAKDTATNKLVKETMSKPIIVTECDNVMTEVCTDGA